MRIFRRKPARGRALPLLAALILIPSGNLLRAQTPVPRQGTVELYLGQYHIADPMFETIYHPGGSVQGIVLTANLVPNLDFYLEIKGMVKSGLLSYSKEKSDFVLFPISLGIRGSVSVSFFSPFAGAGLDTYVYYEKNPIGTTLNYARGWHVQAGFHIRLGKNVPILPMARIRYTHVKASSDGRTINLGGFEFGAGLAFTF